MSTLVSRKPLLAAGALATLGVLFSGIVWGLLALATWTERNGAYPFRAEDWLRYLLPSRLEQPANLKIMLTGPSTVRENIRVEMVEAAFPGANVFQGGISAGAMEDVTTSLQYIEAVYGSEALPDILVLGISPRFIAGVPDERPFRLGIDLYSPFFKIREQNGDFELVPKTFSEGLRSRAAFFAKKQPDRFKVTLLATLYHGLEMLPNGVKRADALLKLLSAVKQGRFGSDFDLASLPIPSFVDRISPYKYSWLQPWPTDLITRVASESTGFWQPVFKWTPAASPSARARLEEFASFIDERQIRLLVVNMPEHPAISYLYEFDYPDYLSLVADVLGTQRLADLRRYLDPQEFYDIEHSTTEGSKRLTSEVLDLLKDRFSADLSSVIAERAGSGQEEG